MLILGIDPGTQRMGYGLVRSERGSLAFEDAGLLAVRPGDAAAVLSDLHSELQKLIRRTTPEALGIEKLFFTKNRKTALPVAQARGVALLCGAEAGLAVLELSPNEIKLGLAGDGRADKRAVAKMVKLVLRRPELDLIDDAMDALAVAIVTAQQFAWKERSGAA